MPGFNGDGTYTRVHNWVSDKNNNIKITASRMDAEFDTMAQSFQNCVTRDGQSPPVANLPMAGYRHTGVGDAQGRTQYATFKQVQDNALYVGGATSTSTASNNFSASAAIAPGSYVTGARYDVRFDRAVSTGTAQLNINGLGARPLKDFAGLPIDNRAFLSGQFKSVINNGTELRIADPLLNHVNFMRLKLTFPGGAGSPTVAESRPVPKADVFASSSAVGQYTLRFSGTVINNLLTDNANPGYTPTVTLYQGSGTNLQTVSDVQNLPGVIRIFTNNLSGTAAYLATGCTLMVAL